MSEAVLCVDDEPATLAAHRRFLEPHYAVETASSGAEALELMSSRGAVAVVVADLHMPEMNGVEFLARVRARHPDAVRLLLTGNADLDSAIRAVNDGHVFRFLTKPCAPMALVGAVRAGVEQYRLITAQRDLLENTLRASVRVLGEVLALTNPLAFGRSLRVRQLVRDMTAAAGLPDDWALDVAATLSQLGCLAVPEAALARGERGEELTDPERAALVRHPTVGAELLRTIPRLERVAAIVAYQNYHQAMISRLAGNSTVAEAAPAVGLLKAALDFDALVQRGESKPAALATMRAREGWYDPAALEALTAVVDREPVGIREVPAGELASGMVVARDVFGTSGLLVLRGGVQVTEPIKLRLQASAAHGGLATLIAVFAPDRT
jgi:response regulator RpfG family c-di-GMP phosphodiesterase